METQHTKGKWTSSPQIKTLIVNNEIRGCHQAQVWDSNGKSLATIEPTKDESIASANGKLIAVAPEMLEALLSIRRHGLIEKDGYEKAVKTLNEVIKKAL